MTKQIEWHENDHIWIWRIYVGGKRSSAYVPYQDGVRPANISDADYKAGVDFVNADDEKMF